MKEALFKFYNMLGNTKGQRFFRFIILIVVVGLIFIASINIGYEKSKGGWYWKPADVSFHKGASGE